MPKDVVIGGGASVINQYLAAGLVDELELHIVPLARGGGARLFHGSRSSRCWCSFGRLPSRGEEPEAGEWRIVFTSDRGGESGL